MFGILTRMFKRAAKIIWTEDQIKEAARKIWCSGPPPGKELRNGPWGHDFEFDYHWNFSQNYKKSNPFMWNMTIYPSLERKAIQYLLLHGAPKKI